MDYSRIALSPLTYIGWGSSEKLKEELIKFDISKILLIADPVLIALNIPDQVMSFTRGSQSYIDVYGEIIPEPTLETAEKLVAFARKGNYSLIIGIGGGSALDMAKLAALLIQNPGEVKDYLNLSGRRKPEKKGIPKILIPTTSGTGTEVTNISVLSLEHTKDVVVHDFLIADLAIVDPQLTLTLPPKITAATGADALTHAIESLISVNACPYSDALAIKAIELIGFSLEKATKDGNDVKARTDMAIGSYLAGLAFFNAGVGAVHALAYPLGGQFHISHGESNAVLLPYVLDYIKPSCSEKMGLILDALGGCAATLNEYQKESLCLQKIKAIINNIQIPANLRAFGIPESALPLLAADAIRQERLLSRCPRKLTEEDILHIYRAAY